MNAYNWWQGVNRIKSDLKKEDKPLRFGILGAARINYMAFIDPVQTHPGATIVAIAAREKKRAQDQIDSYSLGTDCKAYGSYAELLANPDVDAVYIPLPNGLHCEWTVKALEAGKHVLLEKPFTSNAEQARQVREAAERTGKIALEAYHWRFHPAAHTVKSIIESGKYGYPTAVSASMILPAGIVGKDDIRLKYDVGGGAAMDLSYQFSACTHLGCRPADLPKSTIRVLEAVPRINAQDSKIDEAMNTNFVIEQEGKPAVQCRTQSSLVPLPFLGFIPRFWNLKTDVEIELEKAKIEFQGFVLPTFGHKIIVTEKESGKKTTEKVYVDGPVWGKRGQPWWTTYRYQLEAFVEAVKAKESGSKYKGPWVGLEESEKVMSTIDLVYDKAGLPRRGL